MPSSGYDGFSPSAQYLEKVGKFVAKSVYNVDLSAHLAECELNFVRLRRLLPRMEAGDECEFAVGERSMVNIAVQERTPYTSLLQITQQQGSVRELDNRMEVRVYHDAGVAEVAAFSGCQRVHGKHAYPNRHMHQRDEKQQWNRFLGEWLQHCLDQGRSRLQVAEFTAP